MNEHRPTRRGVCLAMLVALAFLLEFGAGRGRPR